MGIYQRRMALLFFRHKGQTKAHLSLESVVSQEIKKQYIPNISNKHLCGRQEFKHHNLCSSYNKSCCCHYYIEYRLLEEEEILDSDWFSLIILEMRRVGEILTVDGVIKFPPCLRTVLTQKAIQYKKVHLYNGNFPNFIISLF